MKSKNVLIVIFIILTAIISIIYLENSQKNSEVYQKTSAASKNSEKSENNTNDKDSSDLIAAHSKLIEDKNKDKEKLDANKIKTKYNEISFKNIVKNNSVMQIPNNKNLYFVNHISAVAKNTTIIENRDYLWQDEQFLYYESNNNYDNFNSEEYLAIYDKNSSNIYTTNGFFLIKYKKDIINFSGMYDNYKVNKFAQLKEDNTLIVRAKDKSNLMKIYDQLKSDTNFLSVAMEILDNIPIKD